jgi:hypothetical protein
MAEKGLGWDVPLEDVGKFQNAIQQVVEMGEAGHSAMRKASVEYANSIARDSSVLEQNRVMFQRTIARGGTDVRRLRPRPERTK